MAVIALISQISVEDAILQQPTGAVSQVVVESAILQQPQALVSQVIVESAILPSPGSIMRATQPVGGGGCVPTCKPLCPPVLPEMVSYFRDNRNGQVWGTCVTAEGRQWWKA